MTPPAEDAPRHVSELGAESRRLARRLAEESGMESVCSAIVESMASTVNARLASVAVAEPGLPMLTIRAAYGYPLTAVEKFRVEPGVGILGTVLESGRVMHAAGDADWPSTARRHPRYHSASFVAVPIKSGEEVLAIACVADRRDDQPFSSADVAALRALADPAALALARERADARAEALAHAAAVDPVSGLFNRRYFHLRLDTEIQKSRRVQVPVALLMIDLDDFKAINDAHGHLVGDMIIREVADLMRRCVRAFDVCTRFGGEEFCIIMPGAGPATARIVAERIRDRTASYRSPDSRLLSLSLTASIGIAVSSPSTSSEDLIEHADRALYVAKRAGKNQVRVDPADAGSSDPAAS